LAIPSRPGLPAWLTRHPYGCVFVIAVAVRIATATVILVALPGLSFFDDGTYAQLARERLNGTSAHWDSYASWLYVHTGTLLFPLTLLYRIFGVHDFLGPMFIALFGAGVCAVVARLITPILGVSRAAAVGCGMALLPSQVLVSSVLAKDAITWFLLASLSLVVTAAAAADTRRRLAWLVLLSALFMTLLGLLRLHTMTVAAVAVFLAACVGVGRQRMLRIGAFAAVAIAVPWVLGVGPFGAQLIANHGSLEGTRAYHARGGSAVPGLALPTPAPTAAPDTTASRPPAPAGDGDVSTTDEAAKQLSYLPRGVEVVLLEPTPWRASGSTAFRLAGYEALVWYPLLALALVGSCFSWRRRELLAFPLLCAGALTCMWALVDGNIGTAFRHRGEVVWAVVVLAAHGGHVLWTWQRPASRVWPEEQRSRSADLVGRR
jgi:hypothetical protein